MPQVTLTAEMSSCIKQCQRCHLVCLNMASGHCLEKGGRHVEPEHLRTMLVCAQICRVAADVMILGSSLHRQVCAVCADICDACITSCRDLDDMEECIEACEQCKKHCEAMTSA